ncbi:paraquat-inducible protein A [Paraglaciecola sp. L3A3]|uniref:paraquat-inducible protein A n=1 Tax=Paraglaciecola sp. L3A3 TaxID=2686358 RepID=UPI00131B2EC6|nr:paraquat-inducible protein A [Paraglaciecola sp. L3A3]
MSVSNNPSPTSQQIYCHQCDYLVNVPPLRHKQAALCPRCRFNLTTYHDNAGQKIIALALCALIFLVAALSFKFLSFSANGQSQSIELLGSFIILVEQDYALLALIEAIFMLILPACILLSLLYLLIPIHFGYSPPKARLILNAIFKLLPWAMAEVFLIGVLISLIKIMSIADIDIGLSFYAYVLFIIFMTICLLYVDKYQLKQMINLSENQTKMPAPPSQSIQTTWALIATSILLYIPANTLPIMYTNVLGDSQSSTILGGVVILWQMGSYPIAIIIFFASVMVPLAKLVILCWLNYSVQTQQQHNLQERMFYYRITEFIGRWSMIDVFVVAILVSLIQLGNIMNIMPGHAAIAFCGVVITTMLAAMTFDSKLIWQHTQTKVIRVNQ